MNELPEGWILSSLEQILLTIESGSRPKGGVRGITDGIPSLGGEHLSYNGVFNFTNVKYVPVKFAASMRRGKVSMSRGGGNP